MYALLGINELTYDHTTWTIKSHDRTIDFVHYNIDLKKKILDKSVFFLSREYVRFSGDTCVHTSSDEHTWPWCGDVVWSTIGIVTNLYTCICLHGTCLTHSRSTIKQFQCHILSNDLAGVSVISINKMCLKIIGLNSDIWQSLSLRDWRWKSVVTLRWMGATFSGSGLAPTEYRQRHPVCTGYHAVNDNDK